MAYVGEVLDGVHARHADDRARAHVSERAGKVPMRQRKAIVRARLACLVRVRRAQDGPRVHDDYGTLIVSVRDRHTPIHTHTHTHSGRDRHPHPPFVMARYVLVTPAPAPRPSDEQGPSIVQRAVAWLFPPPVTLREVGQAQVKRLRQVERAMRRRMERRQTEATRMTRELKLQLRDGGEANIALARQLVREQQFIAADEKRLEVMRTLQNHVDTLADAVDLKQAMADATSLVARVNTRLSPQRANQVTRAFQQGMQTNATVSDMLGDVIDVVADDQAEEAEVAREIDTEDPTVNDLIEQIRAAADLEAKAQDGKRARLRALQRQHEAIVAAGARDEHEAGAESVPMAGAVHDAQELAVADDMLALRLRALNSPTSGHL